ncbi:MAG: ankyrin repeat domain-containing protein [Gammaproteobacteria bacterium]|nr:ankyrin repeat domain-containing protein [Gammaproteobacteria bacterium]
MPGIKFLLLVSALTFLIGGCTAPDKPSIALYLAVQRGDLDQLERHIYWETDINALLPNGQTPLQVAAEKGRIVMVRTLLKHGANIDARSSKDESALDLAILNGRTQIAEVLIGEGATLDASALLTKAARIGVTDRDTVRFLVERGADTEHRDDSGDTALLIAIRQDNHRLATHLVNLGADVNVATRDGQSALALARSLKLGELVSLLQRQGAI